MLIALRIQSLLKGSPVRLKSAEGEWYYTETENPIEPNDIMILLPSRANLRDAITRHLRNLEIPYNVDQEGGLFDIPAAEAIEGLIQFIARPKSRHYATRVARSVLIGMDDKSLQAYIGKSHSGQNLLHRLANHCCTEPQRSMVIRWAELSDSGRLLELLDETVDKSDLLICHPDAASREAVEQVIEIARSLGIEDGGDSVVIADHIRAIRESGNGAVEANPTPHGESVRVMTIHNAKGLESKVVIIADIFSSRQTTMIHDFFNRMIVSPELFAGHPKPWSEGSPHSALWNHVRLLREARVMAEARRLLYVGATRAKEKLILSGSPQSPVRTSWMDGKGLFVPWDPRWKITNQENNPTLGQMWISSMHSAHIRNEFSQSPWVSIENGKAKQPVLNPVRMLSNSP